MLNKKAQGMSLKLVIVAIILLIVMGVILFLVFRSTGNFSSDLKNCEARGGICSRDTSCTQGGIPTPIHSDSDECKYCCI